jgi:hypothetical protein
MSTQTTLLTAHKGVDLHAATAVRVMRARLEGGDALVRLNRAECHTFWTGAGAPAGGGRDAPQVRHLLENGRYFNPNKHHYGHFDLDRDNALWTDEESRGAALPAVWPGELVDTDLASAAGLYDHLLGGGPNPDEAAVDVCAWPLGQAGPVLSGVLWRLVLRPERRDPGRLAERLVVTRTGSIGLLVNPHMEGWRVAVRD